MSELTKILIIAANPWDTDRLNLDKEYREIKNILKLSKQRELFVLEYITAARDGELRQALLDFEPDIVHFSGHGELEGLFFLDDAGDSHQISHQGLANLFALFSSHIRCVVLNACYSEEQAAYISEHINHVIGMNTEIGDEAAIKFSIGFYQALFNGKDVEFAYKFACNAIETANIPEEDTPVLITKSQINKEPVKNYLADYDYDVLIHVAESEKAWAEILVERLQKHLVQKFPQGLKLSLQTGSDEDVNAATHVFLLSSAYQLNSSEVLIQSIKRQAVFLVQYEPIKRPEILNGLSAYRFYLDDPNQGLRSLTLSDHDYHLHIDGLVVDIEKRLKALYQQQQSKVAHQQVSSTSNHQASIDDSVVFINVAMEDRFLAQQIQQALNTKGVASCLPVDQATNPQPQEIRHDMEVNFTLCDAILVVYGNSSQAWVKEQLLMSHRWRRKRARQTIQEPLKIIAVHNEQSDFNADFPAVSIPNIKIFDCPPESIDAYLVGFMEALK